MATGSLKEPRFNRKNNLPPARCLRSWEESASGIGEAKQIIIFLLPYKKEPWNLKPEHPEPQTRLDLKRLRRRPDMKNYWQRILLVVALVVVANIIFIALFPPPANEPVAEIAYSSFKQDVKSDKVAEVTMQGVNLTGKFTTEQSLTDKQVNNGTFDGKRKFTDFHVLLPPVQDTELLSLLEQHKVKILVEPAQDTSLWSRLFSSLLPWVIIIGVWVFLIRRMRQQGGMGGNLLSKFGKSGAQLYNRIQSHVTFADVAGLYEAKQELQEIVAYLKDPQKFARLGGKVPRGVLLAGPPGTGKTLMARAVAGEAEVPFFSISASQFIEMFVGVGASRVRDLFGNAKKNAPSIIFVDELDAVGRARGTGLGGGHDEREQTLNQLLSELDGFNPHDEVIVLAATNRPDVLDAALLRPGRFDRQVVIDRPDWRDRLKILQVHTRKMPLADDVDLELIAKGTPGMVGADLQSLVNEAALIAAREDAEKVAMNHLEQAKDRQLLGMERKLFLSEQEKRITAYPRSRPRPGRQVPAGHRSDSQGHHHPARPGTRRHPAAARGRPLSLSARLPARVGWPSCSAAVPRRSSSSANSRPGHQNDLKQVMDLAEKMVCQWGMSDQLGPLSYPAW